MSETLVLRNVRATWVDVVKQNKKFGNYRAEVLLEPDSVEDKKLQLAIHNAAVEKWGESKAERMLKVATANKKVCRKVGETMNPSRKTGEVAEHYLNTVVLNAARKHDRDGAPNVYCAKLSDPGKLVRVHEDSDFSGLVKPVGGNYCDVIVNVWAFEFDGSPQINCTLETIAFREQGEPLGGREELSEGQIAAALGVEIESDDVFGG